MVNAKYYNNFDDWFYELEASNIRAQRFFEVLDDLKHDINLDATALLWLRAAFNAGRGIVDEKQ